MEYSPPPLFKQGASARAKVIIFALVAVALLVVDARFRSLGMIRKAVGVALYPLQVAALLPRDAAYAAGSYFSSLTTLQRENNNLKRQQVANAQLLQQGQQLLAENAQLRKLLAAAERLPVKSVMSEILYDTRDPFTRKIVLDRGSRHGIALGQPVIDDIGVVGQVTRVFPFTSEVTLLTDKDHAISVQVLRSGVRSVAYGKGQSGVLDLRFMPTNADIRKGDVLVTSGIDGVYPAGLAVATVVQVEHKSSDAFARIVCQPSAGIDRNRQLLVLLQESKFPPPPEPEEVKDKKDKSKKRPAGKDMKDGDKSGKPESEAKPEKPGPVAAAGKPATGAAATLSAAKTDPAAAKAVTAATTKPAPAAAVKTVPAAAEKSQQAAGAKAPAAAPKLGFPIAPTPAAPKPVSPAAAVTRTAHERTQAAPAKPQSGHAAPKPVRDAANKKNEDAR